MKRSASIDKSACIDRTSPGLGSRLVWFVLIWLGSVAALGAVAMVIRWAIKA
jgi:hypothetical protein